MQVKEIHNQRDKRNATLPSLLPGSLCGLRLGLLALMDGHRFHFMGSVKVPNPRDSVSPENRRIPYALPRDSGRGVVEADSWEEAYGKACKGETISKVTIKHPEVIDRLPCKETVKGTPP